MAAPRKLRRRTPRRPEQRPGDLHDYADLLAPRRSKSLPCPASDRIERVLGYAAMASDDYDGDADHIVREYDVFAL